MRLLIYPLTTHTYILLYPLMFKDCAKLKLSLLPFFFLYYRVIYFSSFSFLPSLVTTVMLYYSTAGIPCIILTERERRLHYQIEPPKKQSWQFQPLLYWIHYYYYFCTWYLHDVIYPIGGPALFLMSNIILYSAVQYRYCNRYFTTWFEKK